MGVSSVPCMKCGKKLGVSKTFCDECLEKMAKCPIEPDAIVRLPNRRANPIPKKKARKRKYFWIIEGENDTLRTKIRWLRFALILTLFCFFLAVGLILMMVFWQDQLDVLLKMLHI